MMRESVEGSCDTLEKKTGANHPMELSGFGW